MSLFSERLVMLLEKKRMTQKELAEKAHITESAMSYYVKGVRTPRGEILSRIAQALQVSTDYLLGNSQPSEQRSDDNGKLLYLQRNLKKLDDEQLQKAETILKTVFDDIFDDESDE